MKRTPTKGSHVLTLFNTSTREKRITEFQEWLAETGATKVTIANYSRAVLRWFAVLSSDPKQRPAEVWRRWKATPPMKRLTGYALRRFCEFLKSVTGETVDVGVPSRLPSSSTPRPRPISDAELRTILRTAKAMLPLQTGFSFRVWVLFVEELGLRRSESQVDWSQFDWIRGAVTVTGKTGPRELPLGKQMIRRLRWLQRRHQAYPWRGARGQRLSAGGIYNLFKQVANAAGAGTLRPHLLRHRCLTRLCRARLGENQLLVLAFSGHSHVSSLSAYYAVSLEEKRALLHAA